MFSVVVDINNLRLNSGSPSHDRSRSPGVTDGRQFNYRERNSSPSTAPPIPPRRRIQSPASHLSSSPRQVSQYYNTQHNNLPQRDNSVSSHQNLSVNNGNRGIGNHHQRSVSIERSSFSDIGQAYWNRSSSNSRQLNSNIPLPSSRTRSNEFSAKPPPMQQQSEPEQQHRKQQFSSVCYNNNSNNLSPRPTIPPRSKSVDKSGYAVSISSAPNDEEYNSQLFNAPQAKTNQVRSGIGYESNCNPPDSGGDRAGGKNISESKLTRKKSDLDKPRVEMPPGASYESINKSILRPQGRNGPSGKNSPRYSNSTTSSMSKSKSNNVIPKFVGTSKTTTNVTGKKGDSFDRTWPPPSNGTSNQAGVQKPATRQSYSGTPVGLRDSQSNSPTIGNPLIRDRLASSSPTTRPYSPKRTSSIPRPQLGLSQSYNENTSSHSPLNTGNNSSRIINKSASFDSKSSRSNSNYSNGSLENNESSGSNGKKYAGKFNEKGITDSKLSVYNKNVELINNSANLSEYEHSNAIVSMTSKSSQNAPVVSKPNRPSNMDFGKFSQVIPVPNSNVLSTSANSNHIDRPKSLMNTPQPGLNCSNSGHGNGSRIPLPSGNSSSAIRPSNMFQGNSFPVDNTYFPNNTETSRNVRPQNMGIPVVYSSNSFNKSTEPAAQSTSHNNSSVERNSITLSNQSHSFPTENDISSQDLQLSLSGQSKSPANRPVLNFNSVMSNSSDSSHLISHHSVSDSSNTQQKKAANRPVLNLGGMTGGLEQRSRTNIPDNNILNVANNNGNGDGLHIGNNSNRFINGSINDTMGITSVSAGNTPLHQSYNTDPSYLPTYGGTTDSREIQMQSQQYPRQPQQSPIHGMYYRSTTPTSSISNSTTPEHYSSYGGGVGGFNGNYSHLASPPQLYQQPSQDYYDRMSPRSNHSGSSLGGSSTPSNRSQGSTPTPTRPTLTFGAAGNGGGNRMNVPNRLVKSFSCCLIFYMFYLRLFYY